MMDLNGLSRRRRGAMALASALLLALVAACAVARDTADAQTDGMATDQADPVASAAGEGGGPGISSDRVLFGQSAAFTGPAGQLGTEMRLGIQAAFHEANQAGGVHGRTLDLVALDDSYESDFARSNAQTLIERDRVFALIGAVGTPTSRAAAPVAHAAGVPFIGPFTGAEFLRDPELNNVLNVRASYFQETEEMVARLYDDLGITRVAVVYQDDSFGETGLEGARQALERRDLQPAAAWHYPRNTIAVKSATLKIAEADPEAVIMIGAYAPVARAIELLRRDIDPVFMAVSFVGSSALAHELGDDADRVYVTQVVPLPHDRDIPVVSRYHDALAAYDPKAEPGFVSLEGYVVGRLAIAGLDACGRDLTRNCFLGSLHHAAEIDIDGIKLKYGPDDNQGSDEVYLTAIGNDGSYRQLDALPSPR